MEADSVGRSDGFTLFCMGGDRQKATEEKKRKWIAEVTRRRADVKDPLFLDLEHWGSLYEPEHFVKKEPLSAAEQKRRADVESWAVGKLAQYCKPRMQLRTMALLLESLSRILNLVESNLLDNNEVPLARFFNALNGFMLAYRFERADEKRLGPRMVYFRKVAVSRLRAATFDAMLQVEQDVTLKSISGDPERIRKLCKRLGQVLCEMVASKREEAREFLSKAEIFASLGALAAVPGTSKDEATALPMDAGVIALIDFLRGFALDKLDLAIDGSQIVITELMDIVAEQLIAATAVAEAGTEAATLLLSDECSRAVEERLEAHLSAAFETVEEAVTSYVADLIRFGEILLQQRIYADVPPSSTENTT